MPIDDRIGYFVGGCILGFFLGYVVRSLRENKEELDEVKDIVKGEYEAKRKRDERGIFNTQHFQKHWKNWTLLLVVLMSAFASFKSQAASNDVVETQHQLDRVVDCNVEVLHKALDVLNERTTYTQGTASTNIDLQRAQKAMFNILLHIPPYSEERQGQAVRDYNEALSKFLTKATESQANAVATQYPKAEELVACVRAATKE